MTAVEGEAALLHFAAPREFFLALSPSTSPPAFASNTRAASLAARAIDGSLRMSHQLGSFVGAYGGGLIYDSLGSYNMAWRIGVALGLAGGIIQVAFALIRPSAPPMLKTA
jgi:predicted MFS family arabinose efflux permease